MSRVRLRVWNGAWLFFIFAILACEKKPAPDPHPEGRLTAYVSQMFAVRGVSDRERLERFLTGSAKERLLKMKEEEFKKYFVERKRRFRSLRFLGRTVVSPTQVNLTYEIRYVDEGKNHEATVTHKKNCDLVQIDGEWLIANARNLKMLVEFKDEMTLP